MIKKPLVTVVVPCYNAERYLAESLDSILDQTYDNVEVLLMDDGSTDRTAEIAAGYGRRVSLQRQEINKGIYDNCDDGIQRANGEYIAIYHADDVYDSTIIEKQVGFLQKYSHAGAVFCLDIFVDEEGREYNRLQLPPELRGGRPLDFTTIFNSILTRKNGYLVCPTSMVRADVYEKLGGYQQPKYRNTSDLDMWLRISKRFGIGILEEYLMRYRHTPSQSSRQYQSLRISPENFFTIMDDHLKQGGSAVATPKALKAYEAHRAQDLLMISISHYIKANLSAARTVLDQVKLRTILLSPAIQRYRMTVLAITCDILFRLPHSGAIAELFYRRWHDPNRPRGKTITLAGV